MWYWIDMFFAIIGAGAILFALGFITAVIGGLVNGAVTLMAGPVIDGIIARRQARH